MGRGGDPDREARSGPAQGLDDFVLVWLLVPRKESSASKLRAALSGFSTSMGVSAAALASAAVARLTEHGFVGAGRPLALTERGRKRALEALGIPAWPSRQTLKWAKTLLVLRRFDVPITLAGAQPRACALAWRYQLERGSIQSLERVQDALAWRAIGRESAAPFNLQSAFAAIMCSDPTPANGESASASEPPLAQISLPAFARVVLAAARSATSGHWHGKAFISHVWQQLSRERDVGMSFADFQQRLIAAHQQQLVELSRADLVEAMSPADVTASETAYLNARFHFVKIDERQGGLDVD